MSDSYTKLLLDRLRVNHYEEYRKKACPHCAAGVEQIDHGFYGLRHILVDGDSWDESEHVACEAFPLKDWAEAQATRRITAEAEVERLRRSQKEATKHGGLPVLPPPYGINVDRLGLLYRTYKALVQAKIGTLQDLCGLTSEELLDLRGMGPASLKEVRGALAKSGLHLKEEGSKT